MKPVLLFVTTTLMVLLAGPVDAAKPGKAAKGPDIGLIFNDLDTNRNGTLSKQEFQAFNGITNRMAVGDKAKKRNKTATVSLATRDEWFKKLDTNADKIITLDEFAKIKEVLGITDPPAKKAKKAK